VGEPDHYKVLQLTPGASVAEIKQAYRCLAKIFHPDKKPFVNHLDGVKTNNNVENLEWVTPSENIKHAYDTGLSKPRTQERKLSKEDVAYVVSAYTPYDREFGARALARKFCVDKNTILKYVASEKHTVKE